MVEKAQGGARKATLFQLAAVLTASILGSSMAFVNGTAVNLAIDPIQDQLGATLGQMLWVASIYMLFISALMLIGGAIGDFYGRRATFMAGVGIFTLASGASGTVNLADFASRPHEISCPC